MLASLTVSEEEHRMRLELASRLGALGADARDLAELFRALYDETARVMDATVFLFALYDEASATVQVVRQMDRGVEHSGGTFPLGKGFTSEVIRTGAPRLVRRWSAEGPPVRLLYGTEAGELVTPQSGVVVPILSGDQVLGVLSAQSYRPEAYEEPDVLSLGAIAVQAGIAVKRLHHERRALQLEAVLATMNDALLIVDARGAIVQLNRAARELLCLDSASLVFGQPLEQQRLEQWPVTAREIAAALVPVIDALRSGASHAGVEIELRSGQLRVLSLSASALRSPKGAPQGGRRADRRAYRPSLTAPYYALRRLLPRGGSSLHFARAHRSQRPRPQRDGGHALDRPPPSRGLRRPGRRGRVGRAAHPAGARESSLQRPEVLARGLDRDAVAGGRREQCDGARARRGNRPRWHRAGATVPPGISGGGGAKRDRGRARPLLQQRHRYGARRAHVGGVPRTRPGQHVLLHFAAAR